MDTPEIEQRLLTAGEEFDAALAGLGLDAHALFWAFDKDLGHHVLVLVTDFFDFKGPLAISKALFRAYNASATPKEIDPFTIRLHSVNQPAGEKLLEIVNRGWSINKVDKRTNKLIGPAIPIKSVESGDLEIRPNWIISVRHSPDARKSTLLSRRWDRFQRNINLLAA